MHRREFLKAGVGVFGFSGLTGCVGLQSSGADEEPEPESTPTETAIPETPDPETPTNSPTPTRVPFPETCEPLPDIDGLPEPPLELTEETAEKFVRDFERVYAVSTNDEYGGVNTLDINSVETVDERYIVSLSFEAAPVTQTPKTDGETPTQLPVDAYTHRAVYRLTDDRMLRELRSHIDGSLFSRTCWTLSR